MKRIFILFVLCLIPFMAEAQLVKSSTMTVTKVQKVKEKKKLEPVQSRFQQSAEFSFNVFDQVYVSTKYIAGYLFNNWFFLGGGTGLSFNLSCGGFSHAHYNGSIDPIGNKLVNIPLFVHLRTYLTRSRVKPYIGLSAGGLLSTKGHATCYDIDLDPDGFGYIDIDNGREYEFSNCRGMIEPSFGINIRLKRKWDLYLAFSALTTFEPYCSLRSFTDTPSVIHRPNFSLGLNLGMSF